MNPQQLKELGYPSNIKELIQGCDGVHLIEETESYYTIHDTYNEEDWVLQINKDPLFQESYFEFFDNDVDKEYLFGFARKLPNLLWMNLKKVYFVEKDEDLMGEVDEESPNNTFCFSDRRKAIGMAVYRDSVAFVNLRELRSIAREEEKEDVELLGYSKGAEKIFSDAICQTLVHELFHLMQFNPLIEGYIPEGEEVAENFCRYY